MAKRLKTLLYFFHPLNRSKTFFESDTMLASAAASEVVSMVAAAEAETAKLRLEGQAAKRAALEEIYKL